MSERNYRLAFGRVSGFQGFGHFSPEAWRATPEPIRDKLLVVKEFATQEEVQTACQKLIPHEDQFRILPGHGLSVNTGITDPEGCPIFVSARKMNDARLPVGFEVSPAIQEDWNAVMEIRS